MSEAALAAAPAAPKPEQPRMLAQRHLQQSEYAYARMAVALPVGWTVEDALRPEFWAQVAHVFQKQTMTNEPDKAGAVIELRTVDHAFYAELYVRAVQERGLVVALLREPVYFGPKEVPLEKFELRWNLGKRGYDIIRASDREIVGDASKFKTKEAAYDWINETMKA